MQASHIAIALNGEYPQSEKQLQVIARSDYVIAADGGMNWLHASGYLPDLLIGDLDSVHPDALQACQDAGCTISRYPCQKDETDAELALLAAAEMAPASITLLGATGGRLDHLMANVFLLCMDALEGLRVSIYDGASSAFLIRDHAKVEGHPGDQLSLIPLGGDARAITTTGLYYALDGDTLRFGPARGVSNVLTEPVATIDVAKGTLLCVHTPVNEKGDA